MAPFHAGARDCIPHHLVSATWSQSHLRASFFRLVIPAKTPEITVEYASVWIRFAALVIDGLLAAPFLKTPERWPLR